MKRKKQLIMFILSFAFVIAICGTSTAVSNVTNDTSQVTTDCVGSDPVINGTITIKEYNETRPLANATVTVNASNRVLGSATTDANGYYSISFYSNLTTFNVTANYIGCTPVTSTVTVNSSSNLNDPNKYGTKNIQLTPITISWDGTYGSGVGSESTYQDHGVYIKHYSDYYYAGQLVTPLSSTNYYSYCIDIYTGIKSGDILLVNGPLPGTAGEMLAGIDWAKVNYIINTFNPANNSTYSAKSVEGAAIQCAIWYFTSAPYGKYNSSNPTAYYQFMTYNSTYGSPYDGYLSSYSASQLGVSRDAVAKRAWQIINAAQTLPYPTSITLTPEAAQLENLGQQTITATVKDQNGNPLSNITVTFSTTSGSLSITSGTTNSSGQLTTVLTGTTNSTSTITGSVSGNYGNLLYDNKWNPKQNLVCINLLPKTLADYSYIDFDGKANVSLTQTVTSPVNVGDQITYVVTATNNGPNNATGILISDILPAGFTATPSAGTTFYNGVWTIPKLNATGADRTATLTITGIATAGMAGLNTTNTATRTSQEQYNELSNTTTAQAYTKLANVTITNTPNQSTLNVGDTGTFTIRVTNNGPDLANIRITDLLSQLPAGFTAGTPSTGSYNSTTGIWTITNLATGIGNAATLVFSGIIKNTTAGTNITNHATETQTEYPFTTTIPDATIYIKQANVTLTSTVNSASNTTVNVGDNITIIITATNNGPDTATNINITNTLPAGFTATSITPQNGTYANGNWNIPTLGKNKSTTLTIIGKATAPMAGTTTNNTATPKNQTEYNPTTTGTTVTIYTKKAEVTLSSTVNTPVNVGDTIKFQVTVTNSGPNTATNINITDILPAGFTATAPSGTTFANGIWNIPTLANGTSLTLNITGIATAAMAGTNLTNTATQKNQTEYDPTPSSTTSSTVYTKLANVTITNTANQSSLNVGETGTFTIRVTNNGPDLANIRITDLLSQLPAGFTAGTPSTGSYNPTTGIWTITNLATGTANAATLVLSGIIQAAQAGNNITNHATETQTEYPQTVTIPDATIYVKQANVTVTQTVNGASSATVNVGDTVTYVITAVNHGLDSATGLKITDILPSGLSDKQYTITGPGTYNLTTGLWDIGTFTNGATAILTLTGKATSAMANLTVTNYANRTAQNEYNPSTNTTSTTVYTKQADVAITQTINGFNSAIVNVGDTVTIIVTATNNGPDTATDINIAETLPAGFTATSIIPQSGTSYSSGIWSISNLATGSANAVTLTITGKATPAMAGLTTNNTVNRTSQTEYNSLPTSSTAFVYTKLSDPVITQTVNGLSTGNLTVNVGDPLTFLINAYCSGPDIATNINISAVVPAGLTDYTVTPSVGTYNATTGIWTIDFLEYQKTATLNITGKAGALMAGVNTTLHAYEINQTEFNPTPGNSTSIPVYTKLADVTLTQTGSYQSNVVTFVITATNNGPDNATNVNITDIKPAGLTGVNFTPNIGTYNTTTGIWTIPLLVNGTNATLNITGTATPQTTINNTATLTNQTEYDPTTPNKTAYSIYVPGVNLSVQHNPWYYNTVEDNYQYSYGVGNTPVFYVSLTNSASYDDASGIVLQYIVGDGYQYVDCDTQGMGTTSYNPDTRTITWNLDYLPRGGNVMWKIFTRSIKSGLFTPSLINSVNITHIDQYDINTNNNNATCALNISYAVDIGVNQTISQNGQYITYTITAVNKGPDTATNVKINDLLPTGLTFSNYSISLDGGATWGNSTNAYNQTTGIWNIGTFYSTDKPKMLNITALITGSGITIKNRVTKTQTEYDWDFGNDEQTIILDLTGTYQSRADVSAKQSPWYYDLKAGGYQYTYGVGNTPVFYATIKNSATYDDAKNVIITYKIADGYKYINYDSQGYGTATYDNNTRTLTWNLGYLPKGGYIMLKIFTRSILSGSQTPNLTNIVNITQVGTGQIDPNLNNNNASCALNINNATDMAIKQTATTNGTYVTYTITVTNNGPLNATNVQINDLLPSGLTFDNYTISMDGGITWGDTTTTYNKTTGTWNIGTFNTTDQPKIIKITALITATGTIKNRATKTQTEYDWNYANNEQTTTISTPPT